MNPFATFDHNLSPIVIVKLTGEKPTDETFETYLSHKQSLLKAEKLFALIVDLSNATLVGIKYQKRLANWLNQHATDFEKYCVGRAFIATAPVIRSLLENIHDDTDQLNVPKTYATTFPEARRWVDARYKTRLAQVSVSPE